MPDLGVQIKLPEFGLQIIQLKGDRITIKLRRTADGIDAVPVFIDTFHRDVSKELDRVLKKAEVIGVAPAWLKGELMKWKDPTAGATTSRGAQQPAGCNEPGIEDPLADAPPLDPNDPFAGPPDAQAALATDKKPVIILPDGEVTGMQTAAGLSYLLRQPSSNYYERDDIKLRAVEEGGVTHFRPVKPEQLPGMFESAASLRKLVRGNEVPTIINRGLAGEIAGMPTFRLRPFRLRMKCPVPFINKDGELEFSVGYNEETGIWGDGLLPVLMSVPEAVGLIKEALVDFIWDDGLGGGSYPRAVASFFSPMITFGKLLPDWRSVIDLVEADKPRTGKGYLHKLKAAVYNDVVHTITQEDGIGSLKEAFCQYLLDGHPFISLDNFRSFVDCPFLESFATEDNAYCRVAYRGGKTLDATRTVVMFTSNRAEMTEDLSERTSCVRILKSEKQKSEFRQYKEGLILPHIRGNQPLYFGALASILIDYWKQGHPHTNCDDHSFVPWAQHMDWLVQHYFGTAPLLTGLRARLRRMYHPDECWLEELVEAVEASDPKLYAGEVQANQIDAILRGRGINTDAYTTDTSSGGVLREIGRRLGRCFGNLDKIEVKGWTIYRRVEGAGGSKRSWYYFSHLGPLPSGWQGSPASSGQ